MKRLIILINIVKRQWRFSLSVTFLTIAAIDTFVSSISTIAAIFIGLAFLPWFLDLFDEIKLPGGLELKLRNIEAKLDQEGREPEFEDKEAFEFFRPEDPNLAMVGLRIEIEKRLRRIAKNRDIASEHGRPLAVRQLLRELEAIGAVGHNAVSMIADMMPVLNAAAHGAEFPSESSEWVLKNGPRLLALLDEKH